MDDRAPADLPLIALHPVADRHHGWAALLLQAPCDRDVLSRLFGELGLFNALGHLPCIVRVPDITKCLPDAADFLPTERVWLSVPTAVCADPARAADVLALRHMGFPLMAEGLAATPNPVFPPGAVQSVALAYPDQAMAPAAAPLLFGQPGPHLATGVETPGEFSRCRDAGFHWFAGNYPLHPDAVPLPSGTTHKALLLRLLALVAIDADVHDLEEILKQDAHLSYQLLRLVNSVAFSLSTKIASFNQAITMLGRRQLQRWLQLLLYARSPGAETNPLMPRAALRAQLMETLAGRLGGSREMQDEAFMVGIFSLLEHLLQMDMRGIVSPLNLADEVSGALLERQGSLGRLLHLVEQAELGNGPGLAAALAAVGLDNRRWTAALIDAYHWAIRVSQEA